MDKKIHVYAVIRISNYGKPGEEITDYNVAVKEILPTWEEAAYEVERLNKLYKGKRSRYFCRTTRYYPEGRKVININEE